MIWQLQNVYVKSYQVNGNADDADAFDFVSAEERGDTERGGHDDWIPISQVSQGSNRSSEGEFSFVFNKVENDYGELEPSSDTGAVYEDSWDFIS